MPTSTLYFISRYLPIFTKYGQIFFQKWANNDGQGVSVSCTKVYPKLYHVLGEGP